MENDNAVEQFSVTIEGLVESLKRVPDGYKARVYSQGKNGVDFSVGNIQIASSGVVVLSGLDGAGNSMYSVSHFNRTQFVVEISKVEPNEPVPRKPIGFSRDAILKPEREK
jgi:hypothetical protein